MGKHSKNNCALPYYTNNERSKDARRQGYGTRSPRISKDSVKEFDACWITLSPCRDPVITYARPAHTHRERRPAGRPLTPPAGSGATHRPYGHLYEKEAIYEYMVQQKADIARRTRAYEEELAREQVCAATAHPRRGHSTR
jgi:nitric oxide synthase-interacting protein